VCAKFISLYLFISGDVSTFAKVNAGPKYIVMNQQDNCFFVTTHSHTICKINSKGDISTLAGGKYGFIDGIGPNACFHDLSGITIDPQTGNLFVCDSANHSIRMITPQGKVSTIAGYHVYGFADGKGEEAQFHFPWGICFDEIDQSLLVCDKGNSKIRRISQNGNVSTLCTCRLPFDLLVMSDRSILVTSWYNKIYKIDPRGRKAEVFAGSGKREHKDGKAEECSFNCPQGIILHKQSNCCFVTEEFSYTIRKILLN